MSGRRLVSMVALCFCLVGSTSIHAADFHVSAARGQDSGTCGSIPEPCRTIWQGVRNAGAGENVIKIAAGSYSEKILIIYPTAGLTLQGGWDDTFSSRDWNPARTILSPVDLQSPILGVSAGAGQTVNIALESIDFRGPGNIGLRVTSTGSSAKLGFSMKNSIIESFTTHGIYFVATANGSTIVEIEETVVRNNIQAGVSGQGGAGMRVSVTDGSADITLRKNRFLENRCLTAGGGLFFQLDGGTTAARLENSIVAGNYSSSKGGGIFISSTNQGRLAFDLTNTTIFNNTSEGVGGGLSIWANSNVVATRLRNTIIWGNGKSISGRDISQEMFSFPDDNSGINVAYSIIGDVATTGNYTDGGHNLDVDPELDNTYHLRPGSPAVDAGICGFKLLIFGTYLRIAPYDDIDGDSRPGFGEFTGCDIGADELRSDLNLCFPVRNQSGGFGIICM
jgi:hypothetical protein